MLSKLKNYKCWKQWRDRRKGNPICDYKRDCGYFSLRKEQEWKMKSGKTILVKLIDYRLYSDPPDMVKWSKWQYIGYKNEIPFAKMAWNEYLKEHKNNNLQEKM